jgi:hypothetical protein
LNCFYSNRKYHEEGSVQAQDGDVCMCVRVYMSICVRVYMCMCVCACVHVCAFICACVCLYMCTCLIAPRYDPCISLSLSLSLTCPLPPSLPPFLSHTHTLAHTHRIRTRGMNMNFGWKSAAEKYCQLMTWAQVFSPCTVL